MKTQTEKTCQQHAEDICQKLGVNVKIELLKYGKHFEGDKERAIYKVTLNKGGRKYAFDFGQSIAKSFKYTGLTAYGKKAIENNPKFNALNLKTICHLSDFDFKLNKDFGAPDSCDVLSCLQKYDCGTFEDFCGEFGYDTDSRRAESVYKAVKDEYMNMCALFTAEEMEQLQEIQ